MNFEEKITNMLSIKNKKNGKRKIVFVEGWDERMVKAISELDKMKILEPLALFETRQQFETSNINININYMIIEEEVELFNDFVDKFVELRKGKEQKDDVVNAMKLAPLFAAMLVRTNMVDGAVGGLINSTANILRAAFKAIGPTEGVKTISSAMIMHKGDESKLFADISVNPKPNSDQLVDIANNARTFAKQLDFDDKVAFLSFSTFGSAKTDETLMVAEATKKYNEKFSHAQKAIGEVQFDAAYVEAIRKQKYKAESFNGSASIFIFPDLGAGNIGCKIAQRMGEWGAIGPIITGLKKPFNDLSRGSTVNDVVNTAIITSLQSL